MWRARAFWIGGLVVGLAVAAIALAAVLVVGGDDPAEELEQEFDERDRRQIEELTNEARDVAAALRPVMTGLEKALPHRGGQAERVGDTQVQEWLDATRDVAAPYQESVSGGTGYNVARNTIRAALDGLVGALETHRLAGASGVDREALRRLAAAQRDNAVRTWSAAGVQLDAINIEAGFGHQHVEQLAGAAGGGQAPDTLPEGTDARPQE
jgi:hypothetical protein